MAVTVTSRMAYKEITDSGAKDNQAERIYKTIASCTTGGAYKNMSLREIKHHSVGIDINAVSGRVNELKKTGKLKECSKRKCTITGRLITPVRNYEHESKQEELL